MRIRLALLLGLLSPAGVVLAQTPASHSGHSATQEVNPVGTYDLNFVRHGEPGVGVLVISGTAASLKGMLEAHGRSIPLPTITVAGHTVTLRDSTDLSISFTLSDGNTVKGKWSGHGDSGELNGVRRQR
jgi:hypothetical protein